MERVQGVVMGFGFARIWIIHIKTTAPLAGINIGTVRDSLMPFCMECSVSFLKEVRRRIGNSIHLTKTKLTTDDKPHIYSDTEE